MYEQTISRVNPGCVVFLIDRSDSMRMRWGTSAISVAEGAAGALNKILLELCIKATKEVGAPVRHYFDVGVFGYGVRPTAGGEGVESALGGALAGEGLVPLPRLAENPIAVRSEPSVDAMPSNAKVPVWIEPVHGERTPMCEAIAVAGGHVFDWVNLHPRSFPPIVINITDGLVTDEPYDGADLNEWAKRLTSIETSDGPVLLMNIFLSSDPEEAVLFPTAGELLPVPGPQLFEISSLMPEPLARNARSVNARVGPGARALGFNADMAMLVKFLEIGTRIAEVKVR